MMETLELLQFRVSGRHTVKFGELAAHLKELTQIKRLIVGIMLDITVKKNQMLSKRERKTYNTTMKLVFIYSKVVDFLKKFRRNEKFDDFGDEDKRVNQNDDIAVDKIQYVIKRLHNYTMLKSFCWPSTSTLFHATTQLRILGHQDLLNDGELELQNNFFFEQQNKFFGSFVWNLLKIHLLNF